MILLRDVQTVEEVRGSVAALDLVRDSQKGHDCIVRRVLLASKGRQALKSMCRVAP